jgi:hypothetical protein
MNRRWPSWIAVLALAAAVGAAKWFLATHAPLSETLPGAPQGEAAYNPLYVLQRSLQRSGYQAVSYARLDVDAWPLRPGDSVVIFGEPRSLDGEQRERLLGWLAGGGHLLLRAPGGSSRNAGELFDELGIRLHEHAFDCERYSDGDRLPPRSLCGGRLQLEDSGAADALRWGEASRGHALVRGRYGEGRFTAASSLQALTADALADPLQRRLALQLLGPGLHEGGRFVLVYAADMPSWWVLLLQTAWWSLLPALLALLAWLWARQQTLGPMIPMPPQARRALLEHIQAAGELAWRTQRRPALLQALRQRFEQKLRRRDPFLAALSERERNEALAQRFGVAPASLHQALSSHLPLPPEQFLRSVALILQLSKRL